MASSSRAQSTAKAYHKGTPILLANSPEQNPRAKVCSHYDAKLDKNRIVVLFNSTIICHTGCCCHLIVISPAVSDRLRGSARTNRRLTGTLGRACLGTGPRNKRPATRWQR